MKQPPAAWVRELEAIGGAPTERQTHLRFYWWAGEEWDPIHRWSIWEMAPIAFLERQANYRTQVMPTLRALQGAPPVSLRVFDGVGKFLYSNAEVTQEQWELYRATGCLARPFWILQGYQGGHKIRFTLQESQMLRLHRLPGDAPVPGSLPYAEWDRRSADALAQQRALHDKALELVPGGRFTERDHLVLRKAQEIEFRAGMLAWLKPQVAEGAEELARPLGKAKTAQYAPAGAEVTDEQLERQEQAFLTDTSTRVE